MDKWKVDTSTEYSGQDICSPDDGGCGYAKKNCLCDFRKSYNERQNVQLEQKEHKPNIGRRNKR